MIPVSEPWLGEEEALNVAEAVRSGWVSSGGPFLDAFEQKWADYCGRREGVAVTSGTAALQVAIALLDLQPGDEVIMPTFTIISCPLEVVQDGGIPVLVDCDPQTWTMDVEQVRARVGPHTRAIMPVHIYGHPVDMDPLLDLAHEHGLVVIEDAAEAHGAEYLSRRQTPEAVWRRCGSFGDMSCFSFYANKLVTTGEGGMLVLDDPARAERARRLRNLSFAPARRFLHQELGWNFRMTNLQAALGVAQVDKMAETIRRKRWMAEQYRQALSGVDALQLPPEESWARSVYWMFGVVLTDDVPFDAETFGRCLRDKGIETRPFFLGMHEQPVFHRLGLFLDETYPVAERLAQRGLYLPSGVTIQESEIHRVCEAVQEILR